MNLCPTTVFAITALFVAAWAYACDDGTVEPPPPDPPRPTTVTVNPATARLLSLGATVQLSTAVTAAREIGAVTLSPASLPPAGFEIVIGGETASDPNGSTLFTIPN